MKYKNHRHLKKHKNYEKVKWLLIFFIIIVTLLTNHFFKNCNLVVKYTMLTIITGINIIFFYSTKKGKKILLFIQESTNEFYKITWPTKQETFYTTLIILIVAIFISFILWLLDSIIFYFISYIIA
ncbi:protein translocase subunit SecE [Buchnera aphidicola (Nipponaphis monzeni)]|uniref:Protein translocase subunit SecE n=1 Tax=Buchnera aphidicola (Nipponaphis monzeni) TaxID=2495405 RepID=A0A455T9P9_9GAMM|nr:preprotein translocase subunit SecE [Buchnera aphidicola]BBI01052.1 protein translocase subunit SecE [Buchnera aphidicola (Nipponaphis monzeni)]